MVKLSILGPTKLRREDGSLDDSFLKGPKRLALITFLMLKKPYGFHRRDEMLALLWPERGQKSARNALNNILYHIRSALGKEIILSRGNEEISINQDKIWCDAIAFEEALDNGNPRKALELYRDNLLHGFHVSDVSNEFQDWLDAERERLKLRATEGFWTLAEEAEEVGNPSDAIKWAKKAVRFTPFSEDAQSKLIILLKRMGYRTEALKAYEKYKKRLHSEWEMEPSETLKTLVEDMNASSEKATSTMVENTGKSYESLQISKDQASESSSGRSSSQTWWLAAVAIFIITIIAAWVVWNGTHSENEDPAIISERSVAVLPFTYLSAEDSTDYFSLGMTEEILTRLGQINDLSVISRTSVMRYQNTEKSLLEIANELGVNAVVEGSVQRVGDQVRITAQLIDARTDHHLWSESYNRDIRDILSVQSEVATRIAESLLDELLPQQQEQLTNQQEIDETAYHLYLQAQHLRDRRDSVGVMQAKTLFEESIEHDPTYAPTYGGLAMASFWAGLMGWDPIDMEEPEILQAVNKALAIDSTTVEAYLAKGLYYHLFTREWKLSEQAFEQALEINPNHSEVRSEYDWFLLRLGRIDEALAGMKKTATLDPYSWHAHHSLGYAYHSNRLYEAAIQELETALNLGSQFSNTKEYLSFAYLKQSQHLFSRKLYDDVESHLERAYELRVELAGGDTQGMQLFEEAVKGNREAVLEGLEQVSLPPFQKIVLLLIVDEKKPALDLIDQTWSFNAKSYMDPIFDSVRDDPRFEQIVEKKLGRDIDMDR